MGRRKPRSPEHIEARFWSKVRKGAPGECWPYLEASDKDGYGVFTPKHQSMRAHRFAYEVAVGPIPRGVVVRHRCDNPPCCNPAHLEPGTVADNNADAVRRGRTASGDRNFAHRHPELLKRGTAHPNAKLNDQAVREIRAALVGGETQRAIAARYGVDQQIVRRIGCGQLWRHVA